MSQAPSLKQNYTADGEYIFSVTELTRHTKNLLEKQFGDIWVKGELSNVSTPASGHVYFTLKDQMGQVRCALFKQNRFGIRTNPTDGQQVLIRAKASIYPQRGDFQLIVAEMLDYGSGLLQQQFEALKSKLQAEGLFDPAHKKTIPQFIQTLGIVTSGSGAALHDICSVMKRRFPVIKLIVYCSSVQGELAPKELINAISNAESENRIDALLISRGGGSMEDLWAFNDENLARKIFNCPLPTISAVGHEVDFTIADFVADLRAPTPSAAAEILSPDKNEFKNQLDTQLTHIKQRLSGTLNAHKQNLKHLKKRLKHPQELLTQKSQHLDFLWHIMHKNIHRLLMLKKHGFIQTINQFHASAPSYKISKIKSDLFDLKSALHSSFITLFNRKKMQLGILAEKCDTLSPLATLSRGYAITTRAQGQVIKSYNMVEIDDQIHVKLNEGSLSCKVTEKSEN